MSKLHQFFFLCLLTYCRSGFSQQDCSSVQCPEVETCPEGTEAVLLNSTNPSDIYDECCVAFECRPLGCDLGLVKLESGDTFSPDPCSDCICDFGTFNCTQKTCPDLNCLYSEYEGFLDGACCKSCIPRAGPDPVPSCRYGNFYIDPSNPCMTCTCHYGRTACIDNSGICQDLSNCSSPVKEAGQCCAVCNDTNSEVPTQSVQCTTSAGHMYKDGESWSKNSCTTCTCTSGTIECYEDICPNITCHANEVKRIPLGKCCPYCAPRLIVDPPFLPPCEQQGEYTDPTDPCKKCSCYDGRKACFSLTCAPLPTSCKRVERVEGKCCPVCMDEVTTSDSSTATPTTADVTYDPISTTSPTSSEEITTKTCSFRGKTLQDRERVSDGPCAMCICLRGFMACTQHTCPDIQCPPFQEPIYSPDKCCPECGPSRSSTTTEQEDSTGGNHLVVDEFTKTPKVIKDSTAGPSVVEEKPNVADKFSGKETDQDLKNKLVQVAPKKAALQQQATPAKAQQDEITNTRFFIIVGAGVGALVILVALVTTAIIFKNHSTARTNKKQKSVETV